MTTLTQFVTCLTVPVAVITLYLLIQVIRFLCSTDQKQTGKYRERF